MVEGKLERLGVRGTSPAVAVGGPVGNMQGVQEQGLCENQRGDGDLGPAAAGNCIRPVAGLSELGSGFTFRV